MTKSHDIVRQIGVLAEELSRVAAEEREVFTAETQARLDEVTAELDKVRNERETAMAARQIAEQELEVAEKRIEALVNKLKDARQAAADAAEEAQRALRRQLEALQGECDEARAELDRERSIRKRLEKGAAADERRLNELEKAVAATKAAAVAGAEPDALQAELQDARQSVSQERRCREELARELAEAAEKIVSLELALKTARAAAASTADAPRQFVEKLKSVEAELVAEQQMRRRYAADYAEAEKKLAALEAGFPGRDPSAVRNPEAVSPSPAKAIADKPLPHVLRPEPRPGALFHPDWDLAGLPCKSAEQILQAWGSVANVQLSLEGYPSQYCTAFLVVLKQGKQKQLYILFNLRASQHVLVCVPAALPRDEAALNKLLGEGQRYLGMSGFELEKIRPTDIPDRLGRYLLDS